MDIKTEASIRRDLINSLYNQRKSQYSDIRKYTTLEEIRQRIRSIKSAIIAIPKEKRTLRNQRYKKLLLEQQLLACKHLVYSDSPKLPNTEETSKVLHITDHCFPNERKDQRECNKMRHITLLLHLAMINKTTEQLQRIVDRTLCE